MASLLALARLFGTGAGVGALAARRSKAPTGLAGALELRSSVLGVMARIAQSEISLHICNIAKVLVRELYTDISLLIHRLSTPLSTGSDPPI